MPTVLLIRHGESQANAGYPTDSYETVELTNKGFAQSKGVAAYLLQASLIPDFIVTSPFLRTQQAALPLRYFLSQESLLPTVEEQWPVQEFTYLSSWRNEYSTVYDRQPVVNALLGNS